MRGAKWVRAALILAALCLPAQAVEHPAPPVVLTGPTFPVGALNFTIPAKWHIEMVDTAARGGQWSIPPLKPQGDGGELVAFYFGPNVGGSPKQNIEEWIGTMSNANGDPAAAELKHHETAGFKISQVIVFGTYNRVVSMPGLPPLPEPGYGLLGAVIENPQGNIYWRFTGPEALVTANLPLFNKVIDSVRLQDVR